MDQRTNRFYRQRRWTPEPDGPLAPPLSRKEAAALAERITSDMRRRGKQEAPPPPPAPEKPKRGRRPAARAEAPPTPETAAAAAADTFVPPVIVDYGAEGSPDAPATGAEATAADAELLGSADPAPAGQQLDADFDEVEPADLDLFRQALLILLRRDRTQAATVAGIRVENHEMIRLLENNSTR